MAKSDISSLSSKTLPARVMLAAVVVVALIFGWIAITRQFGNLFATLTSVEDPNARSIAAFARGLAPRDPMGMWLAATLQKSVFTPESSDRAVEMFENAVRLAPNDFRWWIELGRSYEQAERYDEAEAAFMHAVAIAPTYTYPHWQLGNFLLRRGRTEEAFDELKKAIPNNEIYREQVFSLAWDFYDNDPAKLELIASDTPDVNASLALFYGSRGRAADSLRIWNRMTDEQKADYPQFVKVLAQGLFEKKFYPQALEFAKQIGMDTDAQAGVVTNAGFEKVIATVDETRFGWRVTRGEGKLDIARDSAVKHSGERSLKLNFRGYNRPELNNVDQLIVVQPEKTYHLRFWYRTENLKSAGTPQIQVIDAIESKILAVSPSLDTGTHDWQEVSIEFSTPAGCTGVLIRTVRGYCGEDCPIFGTLWYDDFELLGQ